MKTATAWLLLLIGASLLPAQDVDKDRLRKLLCLPRTWTSCKIFINPKGELYRPGDKPEDSAAEKKSLQEGMKGDAGDGERYMRLCELADSDEEEEKYLERAIKVFRRELQDRPNNARVMALLGTALVGKEAWEESEKLLRQAVNLAPNDAQCWNQLGLFLCGKAVQALGGKEAAMSGDLLGILVKQQFTAEQAASVEKMLDECLACQNNAVTLAKNDRRLLYQRVTWRLVRHDVRPTLRLLQGDVFFALRWQLPPKEVDTDIREAAQLNPNDPYAVGFPILVEYGRLLSADHRLPNEPRPGQLWKALPEETRRRITEDLSRLEQLSKLKDKQSAARAAEILAFVKFGLLGDPVSAEKQLRHVISIDPKHERAWDLLYAVVEWRNLGKKLIEDSQARLRQTDSARGRFLLASAYENDGQLDLSEKWLRAAVEKAPDDYSCNLGLAVIRMKRSNEAEALREAGQLLAKCRRMLDEKMRGADLVNYCITTGVLLALADDPVDAKKWIQQVLAKDPANRQARDMLSALGK